MTDNSSPQLLHHHILRRHHAAATARRNKLYAAIRELFDELSGEHGGDHHDDNCSVCRTIQKVAKMLAGEG